MNRVTVSSGKFREWCILSKTTYSKLNVTSRFQNERIRKKGLFSVGPAHVGVKENEVDDKLAKQALKHHDIDIRVKLSKAEVKGINEAEGKKQWQMKWEN